MAQGTAAHKKVWLDAGLLGGCVLLGGFLAVVISFAGRAWLGAELQFLGLGLALGLAPAVGAR